jgi:hypothetical protein
LHEEQAEGHDEHAADEAEEAVVALAVGAAGGEEFVDADIDHDAGDATEEDAHDLGGEAAVGAAHEEAQAEIGDAGADGFGEAAEEGVEEGLAAVAGGVEDGDGDADAFGMLWRAMATAMATPREGSWRAARKVARPSGKLWMAMARAVNRPMRMSLWWWWAWSWTPSSRSLGAVASTASKSGRGAEGSCRGLRFVFGVGFVGVFGGGDEVVDEPMSSMPPKKEATLIQLAQYSP